MRNKNFLIFSTILIILGCHITPTNSKNFNNIYSRKNIKNVKNVVLLYEDLNTLTFQQVTCEKLNNTFKLKRREIKNTDTINLLINAINRTIKQNKTGYNIDARYKIIIKYNNKNQDTLCGGLLSIKINNNIYAIDNAFTNLLEKLTNTKY